MNTLASQYGFFKNLPEVTAVFINQRNLLVCPQLTIKLSALSKLKSKGHLKKFYVRSAGLKVTEQANDQSARV